MSGVINGYWTNMGKVKALCCECDWSRLLSQGGAVAAARRHALESGHEVNLIRRQERSTRPRRAPSGSMASTPRPPTTETQSSEEESP